METKTIQCIVDKDESLVEAIDIFEIIREKEENRLKHQLERNSIKKRPFTEKMKTTNKKAEIINEQWAISEISLIINECRNL